MISNVTIVFMIISALLCFGIPAFAYRLFRKKTKGFAGIFIGGMLSFYLTQMIIRIPILQLLLPKMKWYQQLSGNLFGIALFLGLTAALFETGGRLLTLNFLLKKKLSYRSGLIHGLGHGGIEAILLVGLNYVIYVIFSIGLNSGEAQPLTFIIPPEQQGMLIDILTQTDTKLFLVAGIERSLTMVFHIAMSLLITIGIMKNKRLLYTGLVILLHTLLDTVAVILSAKTDNIYILEAIVVIGALVSVFIIIKGKKDIREFPAEDDGEKAVKEGY